MVSSRVSPTYKKDAVRLAEVVSYLISLSLDLGSAEDKSLAKPHQKASHKHKPCVTG